MTDRHDLIRRMREALADCYPEAGLARLFASDMGLNLAAIDFSGPAIVYWQALLSEAERKGKIDALLELAIKQAPARVDLVALREEYQQLRTAAPSPAERQMPPVVKEPSRRPARPAVAPDLLVIESPIHLELVRIPAGEFLMGSDPSVDQDAFEDEQAQHCLDLPEYYIGKHPVTETQYTAFARATGREIRGRQGKADHPVTYVTWHDAIAFCGWLSAATGRTLWLPTEAEWEKAARGVDGRIYPWGNQQPTESLCNFNRNVGHTTPVGQYPAGATPYGVLDMAGNVWEWTISLWGEDWQRPAFYYPYNARDGREAPNASGLRVVRGGSWDYNLRYVRCASRVRLGPDYFDPSIGFRVVVSLFSGF